ncbi:endoglucanase-4 [Xylariales sp. AK1849]|nr:endoglucanase-4 [Xylariales sp. AK1849]
MHPSTLILALGASLLDLASAHGYVSGVTVNGAGWFPGADPVWYYYTAGSSPATVGWNALNQDDGFVSPAAYTTTDIACHKSATAGQLYIAANAGDALTFFWNTWPDTHKGPIINYVAPCDGECTRETSADLGFSKISEGGYDSGTWATDTLIANNFTSSTVIPAGLAAGNYVIRHEIIALHSAGSDNGAQNYPQCLNVKVGGSGTVEAPVGTPAVSLYTRTDPGILFNLYGAFTEYPIPGPSLWTAAG